MSVLNIKILKSLNVYKPIQDFTYDQVNTKLEKIQNKSKDNDKYFEQLIEHKIPSFKHEDLEKFIETVLLGAPQRRATGEKDIVSAGR